MIVLSLYKDTRAEHSQMNGRSFCKYLTVILRTRVVYELIADEVLIIKTTATNKISQCSCISLKYSQFSNVNNLSLYRIKYKFSQKLQILKKYKCFGRNKRLLTSKLSRIFVILAIQNNYNVSQLSRDFLCFR